ncbi:carboxymuconolactone decarboxylase family protein [Corynebacterium glyciniphilum]|uniref:carboxymuconolactone decarboxylase family protein n=1 Tax=Corynebacterium glyciniphilum TaxID=1404244 RepID=UPI003DA0BEAF
MTRTRTLTTALAGAAATSLLFLTACSSEEDASADDNSAGQASVGTADLDSVSPALARYDSEEVQALWDDDSVSARDRGLVTVAALISTGQTAELGAYVERALDDGVTPAEISETVTHLGFYTGWPNATSAVSEISEIFADRDISTDELPEAEPELMPLDEEAEAERAQTVEEDVGDVSRGIVDGTERLFNDLWLRPDLEPRDRSMITVVSLIATAQSDQITFHLNRAMDNGLTAEEVDGLLTHVIYFTGWPKTMTAIPVVQDVLDSRA